MTEKIFRSILLASMAALLLCVILILGVLYSHFNDQLAEEMQNELAFIASGIEASGEEYLAGVSSQNQIVWLAPNGSVLYSSGEVGDISQNAEVRSAFESGFGQHEYAVSFTQRSLACAQRLSDGSVIRLSSLQYPAWILALSMLQPLIIIIAVTSSTFTTASCRSRNASSSMWSCTPGAPPCRWSWRRLSSCWRISLCLCGLSWSNCRCRSR